MRRREFITLVGGAAAAWPLAALAQQPAMPVVGFLGGGAQATSAAILRAFREGLSSAGYIEGRNVVVEYRWAEDRIDRLPELAADLVGRKVAAIATAGASPAALAAKAATTTIPIVFQVGVDPVQVGLVASLNRPGGNVSGVTSLNRALEPKRLEVLHELIPGANIFVQLVNPTNTTISVESREADAQATGHALGLRIHLLYASEERDFEKAFTTAVQLPASGIAIAADPLFANHGDALASLAAQHALPTISPYRAFAAAGGLMSYGDDLMDQYRELGVYLGHVLNGEKPGDMPVEQATKIELIVNLKTAKALGLTIPLPLLGRADEVIE
jgi:putative tryptophan/tyrosine transport system substrate-binding protein